MRLVIEDAAAPHFDRELVCRITEVDRADERIVGGATAALDLVEDASMAAAAKEKTKRGDVMSLAARKQNLKISVKEMMRSEDSLRRGRNTLERDRHQLKEFSSCLGGFSILQSQYFA